MQIIQLSIIHNIHAIGHGYLGPIFYDLEQSTEHIYNSFTYGYCYLDIWCYKSPHPPNQWWKSTAKEQKYLQQCPIYLVTKQAIRNGMQIRHAT